jgi:hypothetical protein
MGDVCSSVAVECKTGADGAAPALNPVASCRRYCTVSCVFPAMLPEVAVMVVEPVAIALTKPELVTVATEVLLEDQETEPVTSPVDPSEKVAVALNCCDEPLVMMVFEGLMEMLVMVLLLTVSRVVAITLPDLA